MGYYKLWNDETKDWQEKGSVACLASIGMNVLNKVKIDKYGGMRAVEPEMAGIVIDAMQRDLGVYYNDEERSGVLNIGDPDGNTPRYIWHLMIMPWRLFAENTGSDNTLRYMLDLEPDKFWGAYIMSHLVCKPRVGSWRTIGQCHTWFDSLGYGGKSNTLTLASRIMLMFPTLHGELRGEHQTMGDRGYRMGVYIDNRYENRWQAICTAIPNLSNYRVDPNRQNRDEQFRKGITAFQALFDAVKHEAQLKAVAEEPKPITFKLGDKHAYR